MASRRTRSATSDFRVFVNPGGGYLRGCPRNFQKRTLSCSQKNVTLGSRNVAGRCPGVCVCVRGHLLFFNFFPSSTSERTCWCICLSVDRKRDMSYTEPLWEINGNQAPVSPRRVLVSRAMFPIYLQQ